MMSGGGRGVKKCFLCLWQTALLSAEGKKNALRAKYNDISQSVINCRIATLDSNFSPSAVHIRQRFHFPAYTQLCQQIRTTQVHDKI
jgi:hypothetical protein